MILMVKTSYLYFVIVKVESPPITHTWQTLLVGEQIGYRVYRKKTLIKATSVDKHPRWRDGSSAELAG